MATIGTINETGESVDLYIPRKCHATNTLIPSYDHSSVQIAIANVDASGQIDGTTTTFCIAGFVRSQGHSDHALNHLAVEKGIVRIKSAKPKKNKNKKDMKKKGSAAAAAPQKGRAAAPQKGRAAAPQKGRAAAPQKAAKPQGKAQARKAQRCANQQQLMATIGTINETGESVDLYIPRKCHATNTLIPSYDHSSVQIAIANVDASGQIDGTTTTFCIAGFVRSQGHSDHALNHLAVEKGIVRIKSAKPKKNKNKKDMKKKGSAAAAAPQKGRAAAPQKGRAAAPQKAAKPRGNKGQARKPRA